MGDVGAAEVEAVDFRGIVESKRDVVGAMWPRKTAMVWLGRTIKSPLDALK